MADPDPGGKMNNDPCGSGSTALGKTTKFTCPIRSPVSHVAAGKRAGPHISATVRDDTQDTPRR